MTPGDTMMRALAIRRVHSSLLATAGFTALLLGPSQAMAQSLGSAQSFALVGGSSVSAAGTGSVITGDVGVSPGTSITGFPASATVVPPFNTHANDGAAIAAQASVSALYSSLAGAGPCSPLGAQLNGVTVGPGIYCFSSTADLAASGAFTLDGAGTYIFQVGSSLTANVLSTVLLINGADPCNVFWQVTAAATLNGTSFTGNVVAQAGVDLGAGTMTVPVDLNGRALTTAAGAVTLAGFDTVGGCSAAATPTSTPTDTATSTPTATAMATQTPTSTATATVIPTASNTPTYTPTLKPTRTRTPTPPPAPTSTWTRTPTRTQVPPSDLMLRKRHSGSFRTGQTGIYTLTTTNVGSGPTSGPITVTDILPTGFTYASASGTGWSCSGGAAVSCVNNSILAAGAFTTIALNVDVSTSAAALSINTATVATAGDPNLANNAASDSTNVMGGTSDAQNTPAPRTPTFTPTQGLQPTLTPTPTPTPTATPAPDLGIDKRHSGSFRVGEAGIYTLTITNTGIDPTSGPIVVTDTLPFGMTFAAVTGANWNCGGTGTTVTCVRNTAIAPGSLATITLTVNVSSSTAQLAVNTATVASDGDTNSANNTTSDPTNVMGGTTPLATPTAMIVPTTPPSTPGATATPRTRPARMGVRLVAVARVPANSIMYYTVAVLLIGKGIVPDVRASLTLPPEVQFLSTDFPPTTAPQVGSSGVLTWELGDMSSYPNRPFHVAALVRPDLELGRQFWGELTVTNGTGFIATKRRKSYVGNGNLH